MGLLGSATGVMFVVFWRHLQVIGDAPPTDSCACPGIFGADKVLVLGQLKVQLLLPGNMDSITMLIIN